MLSSSWIYASWAPADAGGGRRPGADAKGRASARGSGVWVTHGGYGIRYCCRTRGASSRLRTPRRALLSRSRTRSAYNSRNRRRFRNRRPPSTLTYNTPPNRNRLVDKVVVLLVVVIGKASDCLINVPKLDCDASASCSCDALASHVLHRCAYLVAAEPLRQAVGRHLYVRYVEHRHIARGDAPLQHEVAPKEVPRPRRAADACGHLEVGQVVRPDEGGAGWAQCRRLVTLRAPLRPAPPPLRSLSPRSPWRSRRSARSSW